MKRILSILFLCCFVVVAFAATKKTANKKVKPPEGWSGKVKLGFGSTTGNSDNESAAGQFDLLYKQKKWNFNVGVRGKYQNSNGIITENNYTINGLAEYYFFKRHFGFGKLDYKYDEFSPYTHVNTFILGYGWVVLDSDTVDLILKVGAGPRNQKEATTEEIDNDLILYGAGDFSWQFSKNAVFTQKLSVEDGKINTYIYSKTAVTTKIIGNLALEVSYEIKHNTHIPKQSDNRHKTDTETNLLLVYGF
jgi:putative salt-induced outer membrane protein